ncbi:MAG: hypothetical protein BGO49_10230 [Planctomycetales bacterium 71-10]|nr:MAG: hypothetical protein BGO49_10230 [Planctomycetales bacterium 71-10]
MARELAQLQREPFVDDDDLPWRTRLLAAGGRAEHLLLAWHGTLLSPGSLSQLPNVLADCLAGAGEEAVSDAAVTAGTYARRDDLTLDWPDLSLSIPGRGDAPSGSCGVVACDCGPAPAEAVRSLANAVGFRVRTIYLAAYLALLRIYTRQKDLGLGIFLPSEQGDVFTTLRVGIDPRQSFASFLESVRRAEDAALDAAFRPLVPAPPPLHHLFAWTSDTEGAAFAEFALGRPSTRVAVGQLRMTIRPIGERFSPFPIVVRLGESTGGAFGQVEYHRDRYQEGRMTEFARHYRRLVDGLIEQPSRPVARTTCLSSEERRRILVDFNRTARTYPFRGWIPEIISNACRAGGERIALCFEGRSLSYAELGEGSARIAAALAARGVGPGQTVGLLLERSFAMMTGVLGIIRAGGAYVPIDPTLPAARIRNILEQSGAHQVVTTAECRTRVPDGPWAVILAECPAEAEEAEPLRRPLRAEDPAYVIFTSGTTGQPKGVVVPHAAILNRLDWMQDAYRLGRDDRVLQKTPLGFDVSVWELFWALMNGAGLVIARPEGHKDPVYLTRLIARERVTTLHFVPSMMAAFLESANTTDCATLRQVFASGEALSPELRARFFEVLPHCQLHNLYGPTEAAVDVTAWNCAHEHPSGFVPIGCPIANVRAHVLDEDQEPVPVGVPGELHLGGVCLASGYIGQPALTAKQFVADPFGGEGGRLYRTGDLCRYDDDGVIEFLGRIDHQVKIRGFRIEIAEIEAHLERCPGVRQGLVLAREVGALGKVLVAYVLTEDASAAFVAGLRASLERTLPDYMVPTFFVVLPEFPLNASGKVDRKRLPEPERFDRAADEPAITPGLTPREQALGTLWREVLGCGTVGPDDDFFALGGHSLLAARLAHRIGPPATLRLVFEHPTIRRLASALEQAGTGAAATAVATPQVEGGPPSADLWPLSATQQDLWLAEQLDPGAQFNLCHAFLFRGEIDKLALEDALAGIVAEHAVLRSTVRRDAEGAAAWIEPLRRPVLVTSDLSTEPDPRAAFLAACQREVVRPFDATRGPLYRFLLCRLGLGRWGLCLVFHHLIFDGLSLVPFGQELGSRYDRLTGKPGSASAGPAGMYLDYIRSERADLDSAEAAESRRLWRAWLAGAPQAVEMPTDRPRRSRQDAAGSVHEEVLSSEIVASLERTARYYGATPFVLVLAAWAEVLSRRSGQDELLIGVPADVRGGPDYERTIGLFVNTLSVRLRAGGGRSVTERLAATRDALILALTHRRIPLGWIAQDLLKDRDLCRPTLVQYALSILPDAASNPRLGDAEPERVIVPQASRFEMALYFYPEAGGARLALEYRSALFDAGTAAAITRDVTQTLERYCLGGCDLPKSPAAPARSEPAASQPRTDPARDGDTLPRLVRIWENVLGHRRIEPDDSFFALGGHSLLAVTLAQRVGREFGVEVALGDVFAYPSPAAMSEYVAQRPPAASGPRLAPGAPPPAEVPVSATQQRLWYLERLDPGRGGLNMPGGLILTGVPLTEADFRSALGALQRRHDVLRTTYRERAGELIGTIGAASEERVLSFQEGLPPEDFTVFATRSFDLSACPPWRVQVWQTGPESFVLAFNFHHLIADGVTLDIFRDELGRLLAGMEPPPESASYADYVAWEHGPEALALFERQAKLWSERLATPPRPLALPYDRDPGQRSASGTRPGGICHVDGDPVGIASLARQARTTPFVVLLATFRLLLGRYAATREVGITTPAAGRTQPRFARTFGPFVNSLFLHNTLEPAEPFLDLMRREHAALVAALDAQDVPLERLSFANGSGRGALDQTMLVYQSESEALRFGTLTLRSFDIELPLTKVDLKLLAVPSANGLRLSAQFAEDCFERETAELILRHFHDLLGQAAVSPTRPVGRFTLRSD